MGLPQSKFVTYSFPLWTSQTKVQKSYNVLSWWHFPLKRMFILIYQNPTHFSKPRSNAAFCLKAFHNPQPEFPSPLLVSSGGLRSTIVNMYTYSLYFFPLPNTAFRLFCFSCAKGVREPLYLLWRYQGQICERKAGKLRRDYFLPWQW